MAYSSEKSFEKEEIEINVPAGNMLRSPMKLSLDSYFFFTLSLSLSSPYVVKEENDFQFVLGATCQ